MYEDHAFGEWLPDEFYALHVNPDLPVGTISTRVGTLFAATCEVNITLKGKGGHAAFPHQANDMVLAATNLIQQAQTIVSRNVDPVVGAVVTLGLFMQDCLQCDCRRSNFIWYNSHIDSRNE